MPRKPSPGPWKINGPSSLRDDSVQILDAEGETVTHVIADDTQEIEDGSIAEVLSAKARANARLISAAPDLLKELKRSGTHSRACAIKGVGGYPAGWIDGEAKQCTCSLGEVIAKAEGRDGT